MKASNRGDVWLLLNKAQGFSSADRVAIMPRKWMIISTNTKEGEGDKEKQDDIKEQAAAVTQCN